MKIRLRKLGIITATILTALSIVLLVDALIQRTLMPEENEEILNICRKTIDKHFVADELGGICKWQDVNYKTGCCPPLANLEYSCTNCKSNCCCVYAFCVSCCMNSQTTFNHTEHNGGFSDKFDFCRSTCRTNSKSVINENQWISDHKYCFPSKESVQNTNQEPNEKQNKTENIAITENIATENIATTESYNVSENNDTQTSQDSVESESQEEIEIINTQQNTYFQQNNNQEVIENRRQEDNTIDTPENDFDIKFEDFSEVKLNERSVKEVEIKSTQAEEGFTKMKEEIDKLLEENRKLSNENRHLTTKIEDQAVALEEARNRRPTSSASSIVSTVFCIILSIIVYFYM